MRFNAGKFDRFLGNIGQQVLWRRSWRCSCVSQTTGSPDPKCQLCSKKGIIWDGPVQTVCGVAGQKAQTEWAKFGQWENGDLVVTIPQDSPLWDAGQFDRVTMLNATDRFSLPLTRGAPNESLLRFSVVKIDRVFWKHPSTGDLVEGSIPTLANGVPTWDAEDDNQPMAGVTYSITGWGYFEYFIFRDLPSSRNMHSGMRLPKKVVLRRLDLLNRP